MRNQNSTNENDSLNNNSNNRNNHNDELERLIELSSEFGNYTRENMVNDLMCLYGGR